MKKRKSQNVTYQPPRCELLQLELPLEPLNNESLPPSKLPLCNDNTNQTSTAKRNADCKLYADDRLNVTFWHFSILLQRFACRLLDKIKETPFANDNEIQDFAADYAVKILKLNIDNKPKGRITDGNKTR